METLDISVSIKELILIVIISFIGSLLHEYIINVKKNNVRRISTISTNISLTVFIDTLICLSIDQIIINISPRLILLPPLIIGLVGEELAESLTTLSSSTRLIAFIFSLFGVGKGEGVKPDDTKEENNDKNRTETKDISVETQEEKIKKFEIYTEKVLNATNSLIASYASNSIDDTKFIMKYKSIKDKY